MIRCAAESKVRRTYVRLALDKTLNLEFRQIDQILFALSGCRFDGQDRIAGLNDLDGKTIDGCASTYVPSQIQTRSVIHQFIC